MRETGRAPRGLFVTGTDTGVGKTVATAVIAAALKAEGFHAGFMKPIVTGVGLPGAEAPDTEWLRSVCGQTDPPELTSPYRFQIPAAPFVAAARAGVVIELEHVKQAFDILSGRHDCLVVEGIGGILAPLTDQLFVVDLIRRLALPALVIARTALGSINHTLLTLECLRTRGVEILGLLFNNPTPSLPEAALTETVPTILRISGIRPFGELPFCEGLPATWTQHRDSLIAGLDTDGLLQALALREWA